MVNPIQISFRGMDSSKTILQRIQKRAEKLERHNPGILSCRVVFEQLHHRHQQGNLYHVRVDVTVPGGELVVGQERHQNHGHEDPWVAVRDAFDRMDRQLEEWKDRRSNREKTHVVPPHGVVAAINPEFGIIRTPDDREVYFHRNSVADGTFDGLEPGMEVRYDMYEGEGLKGPQASTVHAVGKHHLPDVEKV